MLSLPALKFYSDLYFKFIDYVGYADLFKLKLPIFKPSKKILTAVKIMLFN